MSTSVPYSNWTDLYHNDGVSMLVTIKSFSESNHYLTAWNQCCARDNNPFFRCCVRSTGGIDYWFVHLGNVLISNAEQIVWPMMSRRWVVKLSMNSFVTLGLTGKIIQERYCKSVVRFNFLTLIHIWSSFSACYYTTWLLECIRTEW